MNLEGLFPPPEPPPPPPLDPVVARVPVGSRTESALGPQGLASATYDDSGVYRFRLSRVWDADRPRCVFVMLNPSTATALKLDPTVTRCVRFAQTWGFGALEVVNVFAFRATDPVDMKAASDPVGPGNDVALAAAAQSAGLVVAAWGVHATHRGREAEARDLFAAAGVELHHLRLTKHGHPQHPLYVPGATRPTRWGD